MLKWQNCISLAPLPPPDSAEASVLLPSLLHPLQPESAEVTAWAELAAMSAWVAVSSERVDDCDFGALGQIVSTDEKSEMVTVQLDGGKQKEFYYAQIAYLGPCRPASWPARKKQFRLFTADSVKEAKKYWYSMPFQKEEPTTAISLLDATEIEIGALEILWRVLPGGTVCIPNWMINIVSASIINKPQVGVAETSAVLDDFHALVARAELVLLPIFPYLRQEGHKLNSLKPGHWILLVAERVGSLPSEKKQIIPEGDWIPDFVADQALNEAIQYIYIYICIYVYIIIYIYIYIYICIYTRGTHHATTRMHCTSAS